jgi:uncharacterized RDD family membrane protein YckC
MYPRLTKRIQALLIDTFVLLAVFILSIVLTSYLDLDNELLNAAIAFLPVMLLEPLLVSIKGGTIGHYFLGLRVRRVSIDKKLNVIAAVFRTFIKAVLGTVSLVSILTTKKHQAIHDVLSSSLVVLSDTSNLPYYDIQSERILDHENYNYPGVLRRLLFIFIYFILFFISIGLITSFLVSDSCIEHNSCSSWDSIIYAFMTIYTWVGIFGIPALGWLSRLYGCKKSKKIT